MNKEVIISDNIGVSTSATASIFGWDFQISAAIALMLIYIKEASSVKVEGKTEDIEINLIDNTTIYSQAKSVEKPDDYSNVGRNLKKSLKTLSNASRLSNVNKLLYITNSHNPFGNQKTSHAFSGGLTHLTYDKLPDLCKKYINNICIKNKYSVDLNLFSIYVLDFQGDEDNRYKIIKEKTSEFLNIIGLGDRGLTTKIFDIWHNEFFINATNHEINISKSQMIWPVIVSICDLNYEDALLSDCDDGLFEEIKHNYEKVINDKADHFQYVLKVISDFDEYPTRNSNTQEKAHLFIENNWMNYENGFDLSTVKSTIKEKVIKLTLSNIIKRRFRIDDIKKGSNL
jgi:hypothetical protein